MKIIKHTPNVKKMETPELEVVAGCSSAPQDVGELVQEEIEQREADLAANSSMYRLYADGTVVHEDDFHMYDNSLPFYDDYGEYQVPHDTLHMIKLHIKGIIPSEILNYISDEERSEYGP